MDTERVPGDTAESGAVGWLLQSTEPAIRVMARRDLLDEPVDEPHDEVLAGPLVRGLLAGQQPDGGFGVHPYRKWTGAHWRLVSLVELGIPAGHPNAVAAAATVLDWLGDPNRLRRVTVVDGLARRCASQEGNARAVCCRLGVVDDRVALMAQSLVSWQWPDGGWNCDLRASGRRSSFHETFAAAWGLWEYHRLTGDRPAGDAAARAAELFLEHRLFRSTRTGEVINPTWLKLRYPPYWHYDVLQALLILSRMGRVRDPRAADALDVLRERRRPDGRWQANGSWWAPPGSGRGGVEAVDWGRSGPNEMITLNALRILRAAGDASEGGQQEGDHEPERGAQRH